MCIMAELGAGTEFKSVVRNFVSRNLTVSKTRPVTLTTSAQMVKETRKRAQQMAMVMQNAFA